MNRVSLSIILAHFIIIGLPFIANTQVKVKGIIYDSSGNTITNCIVRLVDKKTKAGLAFATTDLKGTYYLELLEIYNFEQIYIAASAPLFMSSTQNLKSNSDNINFILASEPKFLPEVSVSNSNKRIKINGDTINYKVKDFAASNDRVIGDVIRRIPGIEILEDGTIRYLGKAINYFYIDGENILDGSYRVASDNLPSGIVDAIQVIENNQHIKILNGIVPATNPAINITINDKSKIVTVHSLKTGLGTPEIYDADYVNITFNSKFKAINLLKANNDGKDPSDEIKKLGFTSKAPFVMPFNDNLLQTTIGSVPSVKKERFLFNNCYFLNINNQIKLNKNFTLKLNGHYIVDHQNQNYSFSSSYYLPTDTISFAENNFLNEEIHNLHLSVNLNKNTLTGYLDNSTTAEIQSNFISSEIKSPLQIINSNLNTKINNFSNSLNGIKVFGNRSFIEYFSYLTYHSQPQTLFVIPGLHAGLVNKGNQFLQSIQNANIPSYLSDNYINYRIGKGVLSQQLKAGVQFEQSSMISSLYLKQTDQLIVNASDSFFNNLSWKRNKFYFQDMIVFTDSKLISSLTLPISYEQIKIKDSSLQKQGGIEKILFTPILNIKYLISNRFNLHAAYNYNTTLSTITDIYYGIIMTNYQSFDRNDSPIQQTSFQNTSIGLEYNKPTKLLFFNLDFQNKFTKSDFINSYILTNSVINKTVVSLPNTQYSSGLNLRISKYIFLIRSDISFGYIFNRFKRQQLQNGFLFPVLSDFNQFLVRVKTNLLEDFDIDYETKFSFSSGFRYGYNQPTNKTSNYYNRQNLTIGSFIFKKIYLKLSNEYYKGNSSSNNSYSFIFSDVMFRYTQKDKKIDFDLSCTNIFNSDRFFSQTLTSTGINEYEYKLRPRTILARISFSF